MSKRVLVAMSGGVDSSVAAAIAVDAGYEVSGVTLKLYDAPISRSSSGGCCSASDTDDARRVARQLGIDHHVFNFSERFAADVMDAYVQAHAEGRTPNPCIECNRHVKFAALADRARRLGFDLLVTGHHARVAELDGHLGLLRGLDATKDQSYVLSMLDQGGLSRLWLPVGEMTKDQVRARASELGLATAGKPDSLDTCFVTAAGGREQFLASRIRTTPARVVTTSGEEVGSVPAAELVTVGQRRGMPQVGNAQRRYAISVDLSRGEVIVGSESDLTVTSTTVENLSFLWRRPGPEELLQAQMSAHGRPIPARLQADTVVALEPHRRVAPGQTVALYRNEEVIGSGVAV